MLLKILHSKLHHFILYYYTRQGMNICLKDFMGSPMFRSQLPVIYTSLVVYGQNNLYQVIVTI